MPSSTSPSRRRWRSIRRKLRRESTVDGVAAARQELQLTIDSIPAMVVTYQPDGTRDFVNQTWRNYIGLALEDTTDQGRATSLHLFHADDAEAAAKGLLALLPAGEPHVLEGRLRRFDGEYRWHTIRRVPLRDADGRIVKWYTVGFDIEDKKRVEDALRRSEAYLAEAQRLSHTGSFGWNASTGEIFWSEETYRIFGYEPAINVTMDMALNRVHPHDLDLVQRVIDRAATRKEAFDFEHRLQMPDGSVKHLHVVAHAFVDEPQNLQFAGAVMDITARKATELALRQSECRYQNLFQAMAVSFFEVDYTHSKELLRALREAGVADFRRYFRENPAFIRDIMQATRVVDVNDQTVSLFGRGSKEELLTSVERFWPEESLQDYVEAVLASIERNQEFSAETRMRRLDGTIFDAHFTLRYANEDKTRGLAGVVDITARKQAFAALEKSEQRYRHRFNHMPIALQQLDARRLAEVFRGLRTEGVTDLGAYFDAHPDFLRRCMDSLIVEEVNERTVQLLGVRDASELVGKPVGPSWRERPDTFRRIMESRFRGETSFEEETKWATRDGRTVDVLFTASRVGSTNGSGISLVGAMDISQRVQAFSALEKSEQRYRHLFHHMPVALWQLNARGLVELFKQLRTEGVTDLGAYFDAHPGLVQRCMEMLIVEEVNQHTVQMLGGRDTSEFVGTSIARYFPENSATFRRSMVSRYRGDPNYAAETKLFTLDGRVVDVLYTASRVGPISEPGMSLLGVIDITERKQAEEALRRSEQRYRHLFRNTPVALWQLNAQPLVAMFKELRASGVENLAAYIDVHPEFLSRVLSALIVDEVNDYAIQLFGARDGKELIGYPTRWIWRESMDTLQRALESRWRGEESFQETTKLVTREGRVIDVLYTAARPQMIEDLPISLVSMIDLTERVRAQEELRGMQADFAHAARISMLGEFTASIAHEVNQPLAAIAAGGEASLRWLARSMPDIDEVRELTKGVVADARRASEIIARIRAMATRRVPEQTLLSLDDVVREALVFLGHEVQSRGVAVTHYPALGPQKVLADRTQLQQVIVNLAINAVQAITQAESTNRNITIRTVAPDPATLRCSVEDSGPGIEPQNLTRLFDSFFTTKDSGMGMGLRICRSVIEAHGGRIAADSESSHGGARFYFTLPVADRVT
jgi:PAS domain S-box-containing protein